MRGCRLTSRLRPVHAQVPVLFPQCRGLDLRRCRLKAGTVPLLARLAVPTTAVRVDIKVSKKKQRQVRPGRGSVRLEHCLGSRRCRSFHAVERVVESKSTVTTVQLHSS